jgi:hypothetical protein
VALKVNTEEFKRFVQTNFKNKVDCSKKLGLSRTHLEKILKGNAKIGKILEQRIKNFIGDDVLFNQLIFQETIVIRDGKFKEIIIKREDNTLIASITSREVICEKGIVVECIPDDSI